MNRRGGTQAEARNLRRPGGVEQPASALMECPVCHPQCRSMTGKRVEVVELMKRRQLLVLGFQETKWKGDRVVDLSEGFKMLQRGGRWKGKCIRSDCELGIL